MIIILNIEHFRKSLPGAGSNIMALAINDHLDPKYRATVNNICIGIWAEGFGDHAIYCAPLPGSRYDPIHWSRRNLGYDPVDLPMEFEIDIPDKFIKKSARSLNEDLEFAARHTE